MVKRANGGHKKKFKEHEKRQINFKEDNQEYGEVVKCLGNCRFEVFCYDTVTRIAKSRKTMKRKKEFVKAGDIVLVSLRDFGEDKADILCRYDKDELRILRREKEIPMMNIIEVEQEETEEKTQSGGGIMFEYIDEEEEDEKEKLDDDVIDNI